MEVLEPEMRSGNFPDPVMVHNDVLLVSRYTVARPHTESVSRRTTLLYNIICFAIV